MLNGAMGLMDSDLGFPWLVHENFNFTLYETTATLWPLPAALVQCNQTKYGKKKWKNERFFFRYVCCALSLVFFLVTFHLNLDSVLCSRTSLHQINDWSKNVRRAESKRWGSSCCSVFLQEILYQYVLSIQQKRKMYAAINDEVCHWFNWADEKI